MKQISQQIEPVHVLSLVLRGVDATKTRLMLSYVNICIHSLRGT